MSLKITEKDYGWNELRAELESISKGESYGKAGIIGARAAAEHAPEDGQSAPAEPVNNATLGLIHEFGLGVPERSFIRSAFDKNREKYLANYQKIAAGIYDRKITIPRGLTLLAMDCASDIRKGIVDGAGIPPPNAPATIERKGSSRPLVDSAQMKNAISYEVVMNGGRDPDGTKES